MVSRRKILSRSRDNLVESQYEEQDEEDVWYNLDKLYKVIFVARLIVRFRIIGVGDKIRKYAFEPRY